MSTRPDVPSAQPAQPSGSTPSSTADGPVTGVGALVAYLNRSCAIQAPAAPMATGQSTAEPTARRMTTPPTRARRPVFLVGMAGSPTEELARSLALACGWTVFSDPTRHLMGPAPAWFERFVEHHAESEQFARGSRRLICTMCVRPSWNLSKLIQAAPGRVALIDHDAPECDSWLGGSHVAPWAPAAATALRGAAVLVPGDLWVGPGEFAADPLAVVRRLAGFWGEPPNDLGVGLALESAMTDGVRREAVLARRA